MTAQLSTGTRAKTEKAREYEGKDNAVWKCGHDVAAVVRTASCWG
jgi:hypothetical protein